MTVYVKLYNVYYMSNPVTMRLTARELRQLRKITKEKSAAAAVRKLLQEELERHNQMELGQRLHGSMKPTDFDDRLL